MDPTLSSQIASISQRATSILDCTSFVVPSSDPSPVHPIHSLLISGIYLDPATLRDVIAYYHVVTFYTYEYEYEKWSKEQTSKMIKAAATEGGIADGSVAMMLKMMKGELDEAEKAQRYLNQFMKKAHEGHFKRATPSEANAIRFCYNVSMVRLIKGVQKQNIEDMNVLDGLERKGELSLSEDEHNRSEELVRTVHAAGEATEDMETEVLFGLESALNRIRAILHMSAPVLQSVLDMLSQA